MRGAYRNFIEVSARYEVCDVVNGGVSAIQKATESRCDLILLHLWTPLQDILVTVSLLRSKLPHAKIVGFSTSLVDLGDRVGLAAGFDAVIEHDGLSKLVQTLKALMPEPPRE